MKASEIIKQLSLLIQERGDMEVYVYADANYFVIKKITAEQSTIIIWSGNEDS